MLPVIVTADPETWTVGFLKAKLDARSESYASGIYFSNTTPNPRRNRMVIVRRDGGPRVDLLYSVPRLGVNVWAVNEDDVTDLAALVEGLLLSIRATGPVAFVRSLSGPTPIADAQPRRYLTVEMTMRGAVT